MNPKRTLQRLRYLYFVDNWPDTLEQLHDVNTFELTELSEWTQPGWLCVDSSPAALYEELEFAWLGHEVAIGPLRR